MSRNRAETSDQGDFETAFANDMGKASILQLCPLDLLSSSTAAIPKSAEIPLRIVARRMKKDLLKVAHFSYEGSRAYDSEAWPQAPHDTAQNRDDFMAE